MFLMNLFGMTMKKIVITSIALALFTFFLVANVIEKPSDNGWIPESIEGDLNSFDTSELSMEELYEARFSVSHQSSAIIKIQNNRVTYDVKGSGEVPHEDRLIGIVKNLKKILKNKPLINTVFVLDFSDEIHQSDVKNGVPLLGFCKRSANKGILIPDGPNEKVFRNATRISKYAFWEKKIPKAYFRGAPSGKYQDLSDILNIPRVKLVKLSQGGSEYVDAAFTVSLPKIKSIIDGILSPKYSKAAYEPQSKQVQYRYLIDVDGVTNGWTRSRYILSSNSLCIKHKTPYKQWFYSRVEAGIHFLEVESDFSDLEKAVIWAEEHPKISQKMIQNSSKVAREIFTPKSQKEYLYQVIRMYASKFKVKV